MWPQGSVVFAILQAVYFMRRYVSYDKKYA